ncbi:unnamed protein product [Rotaria sp. Silwood1]|nr:unnamed protein product [Rotaria sp. Silwood1]
MVNRAHTQTNRSNLGRVLSIGRSRTRHVTVRSFSEMPKVLIGNQPDQQESAEKRRRKNNNKMAGCCCACPPVCIFFSIVGFILLGGIIAASVIALVSQSTKTTTTTISTKTTTLSKSTTSTTTTTTTVSTTSTMTTTTTVSTTTTTTTTTAASISSTQTTNTTTAVTTIITANSCSPSCNSQQTCIQSICLNVGHLACVLVWSRSGDGDIVVTTPNGKTINYQNIGPSSSTDQGILDRDDTSSTGPENIYWPSSGSLPPTGTYYMCFESYSFSPTISSSDPLTVTYHIVHASGAFFNYTRTFTSVLSDSYNCGATSSTLIGSFTYP